MIKRVIILSGPVASGKSVLAKELTQKYGIDRIGTRELILHHKPKTPQTRRALQRAGDKLDRETEFSWIATALARLAGIGDAAAILVDSARKLQQIEAIRSAFGGRVIHIHLTAPEEELAARYAARTSEIEELPSYDAVRKSRTERAVHALAAHADVVIDSKLCRTEDVLVRAAAHLGLYGRSYEPLVDVLIGGQYGSEGKGQIVSHLASEYEYLVRVGGPNAGHTVWWEPEPYKFHVLPSGTLHSEAKLIIGPGAVISIEKLMKEITDCQVDVERLFLDPQAMVIEQDDIDWEMTHLRPSIGSTAQGVGRATARRILERHVPARLAGSVSALQPYVRSSREVLDEAFRAGSRVLLEGTQGTGLSLYHGHYPHVTSRDSSVGGCLAEAGIAPGRVRKIVMVCRTYPIRVESPEGGDSGPMGTEISWDEVARRSELDVNEIHRIEKTTTTNRSRRVAEFNWELLRIAASLNAPTDVALTFADYVHRSNRAARRFEQLTEETIRMIEEIERIAAAPVSLISTDFGPRTIIDRRAW